MFPDSGRPVQFPLDDPVEAVEGAFETAEAEFVVGAGEQAALDAFADREILRQGPHRDVVIPAPVLCGCGIGRVEVRRNERREPHQGPVGRLGNALDPDDMVFLDQQLRGREDGIDQIGFPPQRPAFLRLGDHGVEPGARQDGADVRAEDPVARQVVLEKRADRVFVGDAEMVGFDPALDQDLPVDRPHLGLFMGNLQAAGVDPVEVSRKLAEPAGDIGRGGACPGNPDPAIGFGATESFQPQRTLVDIREARVAVGYASQHAAIVVGPGMVGAGKAAPAAAVVADQPGAAMAADVEEGVDRARRIARQEQWQAGEVAGQEGVRPRQFAAMSDDGRLRPEQHLPLLREAVRAGVARHRRGRDGVVEKEGPRLAQAGQLLQQFDFRFAVHGDLPATVDGPIGTSITDV